MMIHSRNDSDFVQQSPVAPLLVDKNQQAADYAQDQIVKIEGDAMHIALPQANSNQNAESEEAEPQDKADPDPTQQRKNWNIAIHYIVDSVTAGDTLATSPNSFFILDVP